MNTRGVGRTTVFVGALFLVGATAATAKLMFRTDDVFVRGADLIVVAMTVAILPGGGGGLALVEPSTVLLGPSSRSRVQVRNYLDTDEDMPVFKVGRKSLLFLKADDAVPGTYLCFGAEAGKRDYDSRNAVAWDRQETRISRLADARQAQDEQERNRLLVSLLDSDDTQLAAAASNYLNYLVTGNDDEPWIVLPPKNSSAWSWEDYFQRNVVAHRKKWKRWWLQTRP